MYFSQMVFVLRKCKLITLYCVYADELEEKLDFQRIDNLLFYSIRKYFICKFYQVCVLIKQNFSQLQFAELLPSSIIIFKVLL